jgi:hypothetical protein
VAKLAAKENKPGVEQALRANITALEGWVRQLDRERKKLRREKAQRQFTKRLTARFAKLTGLEDAIAGSQRAYEVAEQYASQVVDLEPLQPELPASASDAQREASEKAFAKTFGDYVNTQEAPAYGNVLMKEAKWRNTILEAEHMAAGDWAAPGKLGGLEGRWEDQTIAIGFELEQIAKFSDQVDKNVANWKKNHGKDPFPDDLKAQIALQHADRAKTPTLKYKEREFRKVLGEARGLFYPGGARIKDNPDVPLPGTGSFEDSLEQVQGLHWPGFHELIATLPEHRVAGAFGGAIWDTQTTMNDLGFKVAQAMNSVGGAGGGGDDGKSERDELLEELLRQANQRTKVSELQAGVGRDFKAAYPVGVFPPYAGKAHTGAIVPGPPTQERTMIVKGREGIFTQEQMAAMGGGVGTFSAPEVKVVINGDIRQEPGDTRDPVELVIGDARFAPAVQQAARDGRGTGRITPGGARGF